MIQLSVNVNKIATLRNSRGGTVPAPTAFATAALAAGAYGITVHPRPDGRHIRTDDVHAIADIVRDRAEFNIEGYPDERYCRMIEEVRPQQATLVPDPPGVLTSDAGWDAASHAAFLRDTVARLHDAGARVSLFMETDLAQIDAAAASGADRIEFYTGPFAHEFAAGRGAASYASFERAARHALTHNLGINAGHDLDLDNMLLLRNLPGLLEVSIGHAIAHDALWMGWTRTIRAYLDVLAGGDPPPPAERGRP